jgi:hypothetical protein
MKLMSRVIFTLTTSLLISSAYAQSSCYEASFLVAGTLSGDLKSDKNIIEDELVTKMTQYNRVQSVTLCNTTGG